MVLKVFGWVSGGLLLLALCLAGPSWAADKTLFSLDRAIQGFHAPYFVALDKGYYKKNGLDVSIQRGFGSGDTIKRVGAANSDFGFADITYLVVARSLGTEVKAVGVIYDRSVFAIYSLDGPSAIKEPKDLEGKAISTSRGNGAYVVFPAFAAKTGIDVKAVRWEIMAPALMIPSLMAGQVSGSANVTMNGPTIERRAAELRKKAAVLYYSDWGMDLYSNGLISHDATIRDNRDKVKRFVDSTMRAVAWSVEHPAEAVEIFSKLRPDLDKSLAMSGFKMVVTHLMTETAKARGIGYMSKEKMLFTRDTMTKYMNLEKIVPVEELYTNEFLPRLFPRRGL